MSDLQDVSGSESDIIAVAEIWGKGGKTSQHRVASRIASLILLAVLLVCMLAGIVHSNHALVAYTAQTDQLAIALDSKQHATRPAMTVVFNWTVSAGTRAPDGVQKRVYLVNGMCYHKPRRPFLVTEPELQTNSLGPPLRQDRETGSLSTSTTDLQTRAYRSTGTVCG